MPIMMAGNDVAGFGVLAGMILILRLRLRMTALGHLRIY